MRTGPLVRRGANVSRVVPGAPATPRRAGLPRISELPVLGTFHSQTPIIESSCLHVECKLPIDLRHFLAQQFAPSLDSDNASILDMAANADEATLSRVARAIRRYSTSRAREAWAQCSVTLDDFEREGTRAASGCSLVPRMRPSGVRRGRLRGASGTAMSDGGPAAGVPRLRTSPVLRSAAAADRGVPRDARGLWPLTFRFGLLCDESPRDVFVAAAQSILRPTPARLADRPRSCGDASHRAGGAWQMRSPRNDDQTIIVR